MKNSTLLKFGLIGTIIIALCCFTPILVVLLGALGLAALTGYLDYVLLAGTGDFRRHRDLRIHQTGETS